MRIFRNSRILPTSEVILVEIPDPVSYLWGGGGTILCLLADCQQCWDGTTYIPHYQPILNTESSQVAGVCTTSTCSIA